MTVGSKTAFSADDFSKPEVFGVPDLDALILATGGKVRQGGMVFDVVDGKQMSNDRFL